jgi:hypothetical protein
MPSPAGSLSTITITITITGTGTGTGTVQRSRLPRSPPSSSASVTGHLGAAAGDT